MADLRLTNLAQTLAPQGVVGVAVPDWNNKSTWTIWYSGGKEIAALTDPTVGSIIQAYDTTPLAPDITSNMDILILKIAFNHENRIRTLEGKATITLAQFKNALGLL